MLFNANTPDRRVLLISTGFTCMVMGLLTLLGWAFHIADLARILPSFAPMRANASIGFMLNGMALILIAAGRPKHAWAPAVWSLSIGVLTLLEYASGLNLLIDQFPIADTLPPPVVHPGRLAPNTALCFALCGLALWCGARPHLSRLASNIMGVLGAVIAAIGAASVLGYAADYPTYAWGHSPGMAVNAGFGFVMLGVGIGTVASLGATQESGRPTRWPAIAVGCSGLTVTLTLAFVLNREMQSQADRLLSLGLEFAKELPASALPTIQQEHTEQTYLVTATILIGAVCSALFGFIVNLAITSRIRAKTSQSMNEKLEKEICDRKRIEDALRATEERFRTAFEQAPYGMCLSAIDGRLLQVNRTFCKMIGRPEEELLTSTWFEMTYPDDRNQSLTAAVLLLSGQVDCFEFEKRYIGSAGEVIWGRVKATLLRGREGNPSHFVTHVEDITQRKTTELIKAAELRPELESEVKRVKAAITP